MEKRSSRVSPLVRGILVLGAVLIAAGAISPSFAAKAVTKAKVKNIIANQASGLSVASAKTAGSADNVMAATANASCALSAQTGGITSTPTGSFCNVTFPKDVTNCVVGATPIGTTDIGGEANARKVGGAVVSVSRFDSGGTTPTAGFWSVFAVCPPA